MGVTSNSAIALDASDIPYVAYGDGGNENRATVQRFNGSTWEVVGTAGFMVGAFSPNSLTFDSSDIPYVAYRDNGNGSKATVQRFNGSTWELVGTAGFSARSVDFNLSLALDSSGAPYVVYDSRGAFAKKFSETIVLPDTEAPAFTCPEALVVSNDSGLCDAVVTIENPTATDNVTAPEDITFEGVRSDGLELTDPFPLGETTITWTATDEAGNTSEGCAQVVTVNDTEAPTAIGQTIIVDLGADGLASIDPKDLDNTDTPFFRQLYPG